MARIVYVDRLDGIGEDPVDLDQCRRIVLSDPSAHVWAEEFYTIYMTADGRWFEHWCGDPDIGDPDTFFDEDDTQAERDAWVKSHSEHYKFLHPQSVARHLIQSFKGKLPAELECHRELVLDTTRYQIWEYQSRGWIKGPDGPSDWGSPESYGLARDDNNVGVVRIGPVWNRAEKTLSDGGLVLRVFPRVADTQFQILDKFEKERWPRTISSPLTRGRTKSAMYAFNNSPQLHKAFQLIPISPNRIAWELNFDHRSNSPKYP